MKNITTAVYSFENLILGDFFYIDKTAILYNLVSNPQGIYFLSRPRRFGKSLTISTLKYIFEGRRDLFKGLAIDTMDYNWKVHPVVHIDMSLISKSTPEEFREGLIKMVVRIATENKISLPKFDSPKEGFENLVRKLAEIEKVVILIDEYDKPLLDNIGEANLDEYRKILESFYEVIKAMEHHQRFVFMTGVTKVSKVSIFSKLNNLKDITMDSRYATLLGYTQEEMELNFAERIDTIVTQQKLDKEKFLADVRMWYNGFRFHKNRPTVYNPVSVGNFFDENGEFNNYWFATGTPSFLMKLIKRKQFDLVSTLKMPYSGILFDSFDVDSLNVLPLLIQTGYLTISDFEEDDNEVLYYFDYPNREVKVAFNSYLIEAFTGFNKDAVSWNIISISRALAVGETEKVIVFLQSFYAGLTYELHLKEEKFYQAVFYTIFTLLNVKIETEVSTNIGRIDAVITLKDKVYLFEFKLDSTAEKAMEQIKERKYYERYLLMGKPIHLVGVGFSYQEKNISGYVEEVVNI